MQDVCHTFLHVLVTPRVTITLKQTKKETINIQFTIENGLSIMFF